MTLRLLHSLQPATARFRSRLRPASILELRTYRFSMQPEALFTSNSADTPILLPRQLPPQRPPINPQITSLRTAPHKTRQQTRLKPIKGKTLLRQRTHRRALRLRIRMQRIRPPRKTQPIHILLRTRPPTPPAKTRQTHPRPPSRRPLDQAGGLRAHPRHPATTSLSDECRLPMERPGSGEPQAQEPASA